MSQQIVLKQDTKVRAVNERDCHSALVLVQNIKLRRYLGRHVKITVTLAPKSKKAIKRKK